MFAIALPDRASSTGIGRLARWLTIAGLGLFLSGCGVNEIPRLDESVKAAWAQVENQYQRRADLVPNLVETVKGFAAQERDVLVGVVEARAKATQVQAQITPEMLNDPAALQKFDQAQGQLTSALSRLLVTVERYPELRSSQNFITLQAQLEGTENRIAVARRDYIEAVRQFNTEYRTFPGLIWANLLYGDLGPKQSFEAAPGSEVAPKVKF
ncbi:LemA family protein [Minwuia sp.]|uniref:LemA family protein n=1 Tax=Minwuia sp. TaxID=2493630 RepID=UPI003A949E65